MIGLSTGIEAITADITQETRVDITKANTININGSTIPFNLHNTK